MRQSGPGIRRPRGRHNNGGSNGGGGSSNGDMRQSSGGPARGGENRVRSASSLRHQNFDSNGPDVRVRGNAWQVYEKYQSLARDATSAGDRVMAENYLQHAEHYYRITEAIEEATAAEQRGRGGSAPSQSFGSQQPEVPSNYFTPDGQLAAATQAANAGASQQQQSQPTAQPRPVSGGHMTEGAAQPAPAQQPRSQPPQPQVEAEVQRKNPPVPPASAFFTNDEAEDTDSGPQTLIAQC